MVEGDEEETTYAQATESLKVVPTNIQHGPKVLQRFKAAHEPLVKALSSFENMENHGEPIKPILRQLITWTPPKEGITILEFFSGISTGLKTLLPLGMAVQRYFYVDIDFIARQVATSRMMELTARFPQQFAITAWKANFTFLPSDIQLIQKKHMELLGPMNLIISGWECQGFSATRFGEGLSDIRSGLFMDMVQLITWVQSIFPTLSYVIENTPSQLDQREKVQEHYTLVKHYLGEPLLLDATQCGSYAHRLHNWWTNLAPLSVLQLALRYTIRNPNLQVFHILNDQSSCQPFTRQDKPPWFPTNTIGKPRGVWPTFVSFPGAHAFQGAGPGLVYRHASATWDEPSPEERERAMGFQTGTTSHTKVTRLECNALLRRSMDLNSLTWLLVKCVLFQMYTTLTLIQSTCSSSDATTWHPD
jgi:hypothetical protein